MRPQRMLPRLRNANPEPPVPLVPLVRTRSVNLPRQFSSLPTLASTSTMLVSPLSSLMRVSRSTLLVSSEPGGVSPEGARGTVSSMLVTRLNKRMPSTLSRARRSVVVLSPSRSPSMLPTRAGLLRGMTPITMFLMLLSSPLPKSFPSLTPTLPQLS